MRDLGALRLPPAIARNNDVTTARENPRQTVEGLPAHDHDAAHRQRLEALEVRGDVPRQLAVLADDAVLRTRDDQGDRGLLHNRRLPLSRRPAKRAIARP